MKEGKNIVKNGDGFCSFFIKNGKLKFFDISEDIVETAILKETEEVSENEEVNEIINLISDDENENENETQVVSS